MSIWLRILTGLDRKNRVLEYKLLQGGYGDIRSSLHPSPKTLHPHALNPPTIEAEITTYIIWGVPYYWNFSLMGPNTVF